MLIATTGAALVGWALFGVGLVLAVLSVLVLVIVKGNVHAAREAIRAGAAPAVGVVLGIGIMIAGLAIAGVDLPGVG